MSSDSAISPDAAEIVQTEGDEFAALPVNVVGPVRVQPMPCKFTTTSLAVLSDSVPRRVLTEDPRRGKATLMLTNAASAIKFAFRQGACDSANASIWPNGVPLELHGMTELWIAPAVPLVAPATLSVTVITELWSN